MPLNGTKHIHHAKRFKVTEEKIGSVVNQLEVLKYIVKKGHVSDTHLMVNGADKVKIIAFNVSCEDKIELLFHIAGWRIFADKPYSGGFNILVSRIDVDIVGRLTKQGFMGVMYNGFYERFYVQGDDDYDTPAILI